MPRYYFDFQDGETFAQDDEGVELAGIEEARDQVARTLPDIARGHPPDGDRRDFAMTVRDETGRPVLRVKLSTVIENLD
jgi:hypothetical protein